MTRIFYSEDEVIAAVTRLDSARLRRFLRAEVILPAEAEGRPVYRQIDVARIELLCDLCDDFELNDDALGLVMHLVDQLHGTRNDLRALMQALGDEPRDVQTRVQGWITR